MKKAKKKLKLKDKIIHLLGGISKSDLPIPDIYDFYGKQIIPIKRSVVYESQVVEDIVNSKILCDTLIKKQITDMVDEIFENHYYQNSIIYSKDYSEIITQLDLGVDLK